MRARLTTLFACLCRLTHISLVVAVIIEALCLMITVALGLDMLTTVFAGLLALSTTKASVLRLIQMNTTGAPA